MSHSPSIHGAVSVVVEKGNNCFFRWWDSDFKPAQFRPVKCLIPGSPWETKLSLIILLILSSKWLPGIFLRPKGGLEGAFIDGDFFLRFYLFIHENTQKGEREAETQAEGETGSMHREPDVGFDSGSPGSRPGLKAALNLWATRAAL